jgi:hypothetical protein
VTVDVHSSFEDQFIIACTEDDDNTVLDRIEDALNAAFPYVATTWDGMADFGSFEFDFVQLVQHMQRSGDGGGRYLQAAGQVCPDRVSECPSEADSCRYSCGLLTTTSCNGMELKDIEDLDNYLSAAVTAALRSLKSLTCLGSQSQLIAMVQVEASS